MHNVSRSHAARARPARRIWQLTLRARALRCGAGGTVSLLALTACLWPGNAMAANARHSGKVGNLLTIAESAAPTTLNPYTTNQADSGYEEPAYEPLIVRETSGPLYAPGLATSWHYVGKDNRKFVLNLRKGVEFSNGQKLTAKDVVNCLKYVVKAGGQMAPFFTGDTFSATGPLQVTIRMKTPNPDLELDLSQDSNAGDIISPAGLASHSKLGTETFGAGPYELSSSQTVPGDQYTYVPNPHYYDKAAVHWKKIVIRVIASAQSTLNAIETGQVDFAQGDPSTLAAAKNAGLKVTGVPLLWIGVTLADRGGTLVPALGNLQVRQALNYATNRAAITKALYAGLGTPTDEVTVPGGYGYEASLNQAYPYNPAKAKALLAAAGYPNGFSMTIVTTDELGGDLVAEALAQQWAAVGVTLTITDDANPNQYEAAAFGRTFPAFVTAYGQLPIATEGPGLFLPDALFNPFHTANATLQKLYDEDITSSGKREKSLDQQVEAFLVHQAWFVPVTAAGLPFYSSKSVDGTQETAQDPVPDIYLMTPAS